MYTLTWKLLLINLFYCNVRIYGLVFIGVIVGIIPERQLPGIPVAAPRPCSVCVCVCVCGRGRLCKTHQLNKNKNGRSTFLVAYAALSSKLQR
jgi:hypothetical protein